MISRLPVFSGKTARLRVRPDMLLPVFVGVIFFVALLIGYPWHIVSIGSVLYLASLPFGWKSYRDHERRAVANAAIVPADVSSPVAGSPYVPGKPDNEDERPPRLN